MNIKCIYLRDKLKNIFKKAKKLDIVLYDSASRRLITRPAIGRRALFQPIGKRSLPLNTSCWQVLPSIEGY